ncbi:hypothetical protein GC096_19500 [Paenibacillus sp. LMG 31461]|uniref:Sulfotransferase domain-containing protein n=1 Tax=Paenibacillus plantarum TaxID=2654975 RepID=A0ABX1XE48_9BACL|nr:hypothetical protein [Paenibacillus plantarum]NOU66229.1 hypothetical protein [Paenibacillus plantarum]
MKKIYIHIGMPKTGSSAIQAFLALNYENLLKRHVHFPNPPSFSQAFQTSSGNADVLYELFINNELIEIERFIESLGHEDKVILSSERLFEVLQLYPTRFFSVLNRYNFKIICYVRRHDNLISSYYNQRVKNHDEVNRSTVLEYVKLNSHFYEVLSESLKYTSSERFIIRPYEKQQFCGGNIYSDFLNCIDIEVEGDFIFPEKIVNPSLGWDALEFRRHLNMLRIDHDNITNKLAINALLAKYTVEHNMGRPFQENSIFSPTERYEIINSFSEKYECIARTFLGRENGKLFYDDIPDIDSPWQQNEELSFEKSFEICKYLLNHKDKINVEEELMHIMLRGTVDRVLSDEDHLSHLDFENMAFIYTLITKPTALSKDISILQRKLDFWYIEASGLDPHFTLPNFNAKSNDGEISVKIGITSSVSAVIELFYISDNVTFDSKHCISRNLKKGYNEVIININERSAIKSLRLDPGNVEGVYLLHQFEVKVKKLKEM